MLTLQSMRTKADCMLFDDIPTRSHSSLDTKSCLISTTKIVTNVAPA